MLMHLLRCASSLRVVFSSSSSSNSSVSSSKTPKIRLMTSEKTLDTKEEKILTTKIIVLGTNHTSSSDAEKVTRIIEDEKPDVVVVELDFERLNSNSNSYKICGKDFMNAVKSGIAIKQDPIVLLGT